LTLAVVEKSQEPFEIEGADVLHDSVERLQRFSAASQAGHA
jgi:hypothetical protein